MEIVKKNGILARLHGFSIGMTTYNISLDCKQRDIRYGPGGHLWRRDSRGRVQL